MFVNLEYPDPRVALITLARPERMNALSVPLAQDLKAAIETVVTNPDIAVMILTGQGRGFCAGGDIKEMHSNRDKSLQQRSDDLVMMQKIPQMIRAMPQVTITAVNGHAFGAGFALALTCDIVLSAQDATYGTAYLRQGLVTDFGLSYQLTKLTSPAVARRLIFLDKVLSANEALEHGLVSEVLPADRLLPRALEMAHKIAEWPTDARSEMKSILRQAETAEYQQVLDNETKTQNTLLASPDHAAAVDAFLHG